MHFQHGLTLTIAMSARPIHSMCRLKDEHTLVQIIYRHIVLESGMNAHREVRVLRRYSIVVRRVSEVRGQCKQICWKGKARGAYAPAKHAATGRGKGYQIVIRHLEIL